MNYGWVIREKSKTPLIFYHNQSHAGGMIINVLEYIKVEYIADYAMGC